MSEINFYCSSSPVSVLSDMTVRSGASVNRLSLRMAALASSRSIWATEVRSSYCAGEGQMVRARWAAIWAAVLCGGWIPSAARSALIALRLARSASDRAGLFRHTGQAQATGAGAGAACIGGFA
jgi:hypothetical protein